jgi:endonuclease/exonuclease/phosphatase family metal-dependent hydrolase
VKLNVMSYNIRFGGRGREARLAEVIKRASPDLVVFQEATDTRVIERISKETGMTSWAARPAHSIAFASRVPVPYHEWHYPKGARHSFLEIVLENDARIFGLHLKARFSKWSERRRAFEIRSLLDGIKRHEHGFHLLLGDFNTLAPGELLDVRNMPHWIRALVWISGRDIQRETIQIMLDANYSDGYRTLHPEDKGYTFPVWNPHLRLDYIFLPQAFIQKLISCEVIKHEEARQASDHFPLLSQLEID